MEVISFDSLLKNFSKYNLVGIPKVRKAYEFAKLKHDGQYRASGEEYITHPLNVANILTQLCADTDTICAALLHDVVEDTDTSLEDIKAEFGETVARLVEGVTNLTKLSFSNKESFNNANIRKVILGMAKDVRIVLIKIADRLHNMKTLEYKKPEKQKLKSMETLEIYAPLARDLGLHDIKCDLEDNSFMYLMPDLYKKTKDERDKIENESRKMVKEISEKLNFILNEQHIPNIIKFRLKSIYSIFRDMLSKGLSDITDLHNLFMFSIILDNINDCYISLRYIHENFAQINGGMSDYIGTPKGNHYRAFHTTVVGPEEKLLLMILKTYDMDETARNGIAEFWFSDSNEAFSHMQDSLTSSQFFRDIVDVNRMASNNKEFLDLIKGEIFAEKINVFTMGGKPMLIVNGATAIDFAYQIHTEIGNKMVAVIVNGKSVGFDYVLKKDDRVRIITDPLAEGPSESWLGIAKTARAKKKIKEFIKNKNKGYSLVRIP